MPQLKPGQVKADWGKGKFSSVYLFDGPDDLTKEDLLLTLTGILLKDSSKDFNYDVFDGSSVQVNDVIGACLTVPFLSEKRLVILKNTQELETQPAQTLAKNIQDFPPTVCLVMLYEGYIHPQDQLSTHVSSYGAWVRFWAPQSWELPGWIASRTKAAGKNITSQAAQTLAENFGNASLRELAEEINKLVLFAGDRKVIEEKDVSQFPQAATVKENSFKAIRRTIFETAAAQFKNVKLNNRLLKLAVRLIEEGKSPESVLFAVTESFRLLLYASPFISDGIQIPAERLRRFGISSKTDTGYLEKAAKALNPDKAMHALHLSLNTELDIKTGMLDPETALSLFIVESVLA